MCAIGRPGPGCGCHKMGGVVSHSIDDTNALSGAPCHPTPEAKTVVFPRYTALMCSTTAAGGFLTSPRLTHILI